ncbi:hypothetical protein CHUAL_012005 [Chamberlinius hualienensis]
MKGYSQKISYTGRSSSRLNPAGLKGAVKLTTNSAAGDTIVMFFADQGSLNKAWQKCGVFNDRQKDSNDVNRVLLTGLASKINLI